MSKEELLANCIDEIDSGKCTIEECLARHPELSDELKALLEIAQCLQSEKVTPSPEFKARARGRLVQEMRTPVPLLPSKARWRSRLFRPFAPALRPAIAASLVVIGLSAAGSATVAAAQGSLPQDTLYPVKRTVENLQLTFTAGPEARARFNAELAQRRVDEAVAETKMGRGVNVPALATTSAYLDAAVRDVGESSPDEVRPLLGTLSWASLKQQMELNQALSHVPEASQPAVRKAIDATRRAGLIAEIAYGNPSFLSTSPSVEDQQLDASHFQVEGVFLGVEDGSWNVGGVLIHNVNSAQAAPAPNQRVHIEGMVSRDQAFVSDVREQDNAPDQVVIQGTFQGTSDDGARWRISGIPVARPQDSPAPPEGSLVQVQGTINGNDLVGSVAEDNEDSGSGVQVAGTLVSANAQQKTIAVKVTGSDVVIDLNQASIQDGGGQSMGLTDLTSLSGAEVQASGLRQEDGVVSASQVHVNVQRKPSTGDQEPHRGGDNTVQPAQTDNHDRESDQAAQPTPSPRPTATPASPTALPTATARPTPTQDWQRPTATPRPTAEDSDHAWATPTPRPSATPGSDYGNHDLSTSDSYHDSQTYGH